MFEVNKGTTYIYGKSGIYDNVIQNKDVRYSRNAANNYISAYSVENIPAIPQRPEMPDLNTKSDDFYDKLDRFIAESKLYLEELDKADNQTPRAKFKLKYATLNNGKINPISAVAMAFEELGKNLEISVHKLTSKLSESTDTDLVSAKSLDLNNDGKVDVAEYASSILVEDMLSSNKDGNLKPKDVNGRINYIGQNKLLSFANIKNYETAHNIFKQVYKDFKLEKALSEFISNPNNMV